MKWVPSDLGWHSQAGTAIYNDRRIIRSTGELFLIELSRH